MKPWPQTVVKSVIQKIKGGLFFYQQRYLVDLLQSSDFTNFRPSATLIEPVLDMILISDVFERVHNIRLHWREFFVIVRLLDFGIIASCRDLLLRRLLRHRLGWGQDRQTESKWDPRLSSSQPSRDQVRNLNFWPHNLIYTEAVYNRLRKHASFEEIHDKINNPACD